MTYLSASMLTVMEAPTQLDPLVQLPKKTNSVKGWAEFGTTRFTTTGETDIFVTKLDSSGNFVWTQVAGGPSHEWGFGIQGDASGNIYVAGWYNQQVAFGSQTVTSKGKGDIFVAKLDSKGKYMWVRSAGGLETDFARALAVSPKGNIAITGYFAVEATFGQRGVTSQGFQDPFVAVLDSQGNFKNVYTGGSSTSDFGGYGVGFDPLGNVISAGRFSQTARFTTGQSLTTKSPTSVYVWKIAPTVP